MSSPATIAAVDRAAAAHGLEVVGAFHPADGDGAPDAIATLCLLGARGDRMWAAFSASSEAADGRPDPLDRWSARVVGGLAVALGGIALFPFGGPPYQPFQRWGIRGEAAVPSPVGMHATPRRGLWASYRGALGFDVALVLPPQTDTNPCAPCPAPCRTACPVEAFAGGRYDVPRCLAHITVPEGAECRERGCLARRACPAGRDAEPPAGQRGFHMAAFIRAQRAAAG